jgi:hypothetical protein
MEMIYSKLRIILKHNYFHIKWCLEWLLQNEQNLKMLKNVDIKQTSTLLVEI